jgi:hypothetical protein
MASLYRISSVRARRFNFRSRGSGRGCNHWLRRRLWKPPAGYPGAVIPPPISQAWWRLPGGEVPLILCDTGEIQDDANNKSRGLALFRHGGKRNPLDTA